MMILKLHLVMAFLISLTSIIGFGFMSLWINDHKIVHFDRSIIASIQGLETPGLSRIM